MKKSVTVKQHDGAVNGNPGKTEYTVTKTVNTTKPKVGEVLNEGDIEYLISKRVQVTVLG